MRFLGLAAALCFCITSSTSAFAGIYLNASYKGADQRIGWQEIKSKGISAGISVDLGRYIRLGYTYEDSYQTASGYEDPRSTSIVFEKDADGNIIQRPIFNEVHTKAHSIDLRVILYEGQTVTPYLIGGAIVRDVTTVVYDPVSKQYGKSDTGMQGPEPQGGLGAQVGLTAAFSLQLQYMISRGGIATPNGTSTGKAKQTTDASSSIGLTYKI